MMMFAGPEFPDAGNGFRQLLVQGFPALFDRGGREIAGVADLAVEQVPGRLIVGKRRGEAAWKRRDAVRAFSHEREERIQTGNAA